MSTQYPCSSITLEGWCLTHRGRWIDEFGCCDVAHEQEPNPHFTMEKWLHHSRILQMTTFGGDPTLLVGEERAEFVRRMVLGLMTEATEALNEVGWKWWSAKDHFNRDKFLEELVDVVHFVGGLAAMAGCTDEEWRAIYAAKSAVNRSRQQEGY